MLYYYYYNSNISKKTRSEYSSFSDEYFFVMVFWNKKKKENYKKRNAEKKKAYNQQYRHDFLKSRKKDEYDTFFCEYPWCGNLAVDIHHIHCPYRGQRKHNPNGSDLIALCREHHEYVTFHNTQSEKDKLLEAVASLIFS